MGNMANVHVHCSVTHAVNFYCAYAGIDVRLQTKVTELDPAGKSVTIQGGASRNDIIHYDYLIVATGSKVGFTGLSHVNVQYREVVLR